MIKLLAKLGKSSNYRNFSWRLMQIVSRQGSSFVIFLFSAKLLGPYNFGIYSYIFAVVSLFSIICDFGISVSVSKISAEFKEAQDPRLKSVLSNALLIALAMFLLAFLFLLGFGKFFFHDNLNYVMLASPLFFLMPAVAIADGYYRGLEKFKILSIINLIFGLLFTPLSYFATKSFGLSGAFVVLSAFNLGLLIALLAYGGQKHYQFERSIVNMIGRSAAVIGLLSAGYFLYTKTDVLILKQADMIREIGFYELSNKIILILSLPFMVFATVLGPVVSKHYVQKDWLSIKSLLRKYVLKSFITSFITGALLFPFIPFVVRYFIPGLDKSMVAWSMVALFAVFVVEMMTVVVGNSFIIFTGFAKLNLVLLIIFGISNVLLDYWLINSYGFIGVIYSKLIVCVGLGGLLYLIYYKTISMYVALGGTTHSIRAN